MTPKQAARLYAKTSTVRSVMQAAGCDFYNAKKLITVGGGKLLPLRRKSRLSKEEIVSLYERYSVRHVASLNNTSNSIILRVLKEAGVKMRPQGHNDIRVAPTKHGHCQAAARLGMTPYRYVRLMAVVKMGGICRECSEEDLLVLDINHINGEGAPQEKEGAATALKYKECIRILAGEEMHHVEVLCCNCNRRHEVHRGNIPPIPEMFYAHTSTD